MANATSLKAPAQRPPLPPQLGDPLKFFKSAALAMFFLIILLALGIIVMWLIIRPRHLRVTAEDAYVHNFNLTGDRLSATFELTLEINNCNRHVSFYYDNAEFFVRYRGQKLAFEAIQPFHQGHKNVTRLYMKPAAQNVLLFEKVSRKLRLEKAARTVELDVQIRAKVRYKVGTWKPKDRKVKIYCSPVVGHFTRSNSFLPRKKCNVEF